MANKKKTKSKRRINSTSKEQATSGRNPWFDMWQKFNEWLTTPYSMPLSDTAKDVYEKVLDANKMYLSLFHFWNTLAKNAEQQITPEHFKGILTVWLDNQRDMFSRLFGLPLPVMPADVKDPTEWAKGMKSSLENWARLYQENYHPALEGWRKVSENVMEMLNPNVAPAKSKEFYDSWTKAYEETLGKFLKIPTVGPSRQVLDKMMKSIDSFIRYGAAAVDFSLALYKPSLQAIEEISPKVAETFKGKITPEQYKEFYELLVKTFEEKFYALFKSPAFAELLNTTLEASLNFRRHYFGVMEEMLKETPVVTDRKMDQVYQDLYNLKKRVKELEKITKEAK